MSSSVGTLELTECSSCQLRYVPSDSPCPHCGSRERVAYSVPALGKVLVATELVNPSEGWTAPHRLALVEMSDSVRLLAIVDGVLPAPGAVVSVRKDGEVYRAHPEPTTPKPAERGEGESPRVGRSDASFEPPR